MCQHAAHRQRSSSPPPWPTVRRRDTEVRTFLRARRRSSPPANVAAPAEGDGPVISADVHSVRCEGRSAPPTPPGMTAPRISLTAVRCCGGDQPVVATPDPGCAPTESPCIPGRSPRASCCASPRNDRSARTAPPKASSTALRSGEAPSPSDLRRVRRGKHAAELHDPARAHSGLGTMRLRRFPTPLGGRRGRRQLRRSWC
jgi:hypothetical protein